MFVFGKLDELVDDHEMASSSDGNFSITLLPNDSYPRCDFYRKHLVFNNIQLARVIVTWILFVFSALGNVFVLYCLLTNKKRSHVHVITFHVILADLAFTFFVIPVDGVWNVTISWDGGELLCKICQMLKQFAMYVSSSMVTVVALERMIGIMNPMQRIGNRTRIMLGFAWGISLLSSIPSCVLFKLISPVLCEGDDPFVQCVDSLPSERPTLRPYYFFTMTMTFILPFLLSLISYLTIFYEISNMQKRDQELIGAVRPTNHSKIANAKRKTIALTSMVSLSFIILWGPYYALGIYTWFHPKLARNIPREANICIFLLLYLHPALHPFIYGVFMKDVRKKFMTMVGKISNCVRSNEKMSLKQLRIKKLFCPCCHTQRMMSTPSSSSSLRHASAQSQSTKLSLLSSPTSPMELRKKRFDWSKTDLENNQYV